MEIACAARSCSDQPGLKPPVAKEQSVTPGVFFNPRGAFMGNTSTHFLLSQLFPLTAQVISKHSEAF